MWWFLFDNAWAPKKGPVKNSSVKERGSCLERKRCVSGDANDSSEFMGKTFQAAQLTHERFLTIDHSCKIFFWYLPNWTSTDLWCVVLYVTFSTTNQRSVEVQFGRYQKNILQEWCRVKKLSCVSCGSLKRFPHTFATVRLLLCTYYVLWVQEEDLTGGRSKKRTSFWIIRCLWVYSIQMSSIW